MNKYNEINERLFKLNIKEINEEEITILAEKQGISPEEVIQNIKFALNDLEYTTYEISNIIKKNSYSRFTDKLSINGYGLNGELNKKYLCYDKVNRTAMMNIKDLALVTGFGPTNAPTAGTLSMIFRILELQKQTGIYTHIIISDMGAFNSRQKPLENLIKKGKQFKKFIVKLGFDTNNGIIRTHNDREHARVFSMVSSVLTVNDFINHDEATADMYKRLNLQGNDFSTMVDQTFTVADIILPIIKDGKRGVIVSAGIEEHYYPQLSNIVLKRLKKKQSEIRSMVSDDAVVSAIYGKLISGLFPYVKMSKSIPESAINIGDNECDIVNKILNCTERNEEVILNMIELASNWSYERINSAETCFKERNTKPENWKKIKLEYCEFFLGIKKIWDSCEDEMGELRNEIFF